MSKLYWIEPELHQICQQLLHSLSHLESIGIYHRDLKPRNFLKDFKGNAELCDFGLSTTAPIPKIVKAWGTPIYMDPMTLKAYRSRYRRLPGKLIPKADVFSFGLSILEMGNLLNYKTIKLN